MPRAEFYPKCRPSTAILMFLTLLVLVWAAPTAAEAPVLTVDDEQVSVDEVLYLLGAESGAGDQAASLLAGQMTEDEMDAFLMQISRAILFSKGAIIRGLHLDPGVAARIRWARINALAEAYVGSMAPDLDFSEKQMRTYFEQHRDAYVQKERAHVRHILLEDEDSASTVLLRLISGEDFQAVASSMSKDSATSQKGGDLGWVGRGELPGPLDDAVFSAPLKSASGPVRTGYGLHVFEVVERTRMRQLPFAEALDMVRADMTEEAMASETASLARRFQVQSDPDIIKRNLLRR